ncbi:hypothetical protein CCUS01_01734 [Colletotrichum cuscutae]|uniref:Uncharacterized protein n=1 Tax=Colletotrichum cuscutae TaxID=1209917 RepID=A0AAI9UF83_9PEZI|nr:hypothetical protein CCUS01_01734 [Colletotrichum cuscutae]
MRRIVESSAGTTVQKRMEAQNMGGPCTRKEVRLQPQSGTLTTVVLPSHPIRSPTLLLFPSRLAQNIRAVRPYRPVLSYGSIRADFVSALFIAMSRLYRAQLSARPTSSHFFTLSRPYLNKFAWHPSVKGSVLSPKVASAGTDTDYDPERQPCLGPFG